MADFVLFVSAAELDLGWEEGSYNELYRRNGELRHIAALAASPVGGLILKIDTPFHGTATQLYRKIENKYGCDHVLSKGIPVSPIALGRELRRIKPNLRAFGVDIKFERSSSERIILIDKPTKTVDT